MAHNIIPLTKWYFPHSINRLRHTPPDVAACFSRLFSMMLSLRYGAGTAGLRPGAERLIRRQVPAMRQIYEYHLSLTGISIPEVEIFMIEEKV